jgi:hypothetical protein
MFLFATLIVTVTLASKPRFWQDLKSRMRQIFHAVPQHTRSVTMANVNVTISIEAIPNNPAQPWCVRYTPPPQLQPDSSTYIIYTLDEATAKMWAITGFGGLSIDTKNIVVTLQDPIKTGHWMPFLTTDGSLSPPQADITTLHPTNPPTTSVTTCIAATNKNFHTLSFCLQYSGIGTNSHAGILIDDPEVKCPPKG